MWALSTPCNPSIGSVNDITGGQIDISIISLASLVGDAIMIHLKLGLESGNLSDVTILNEDKKKQNSIHVFVSQYFWEKNNITGSLC